jgi:hypothetical protein
LKASVESGQLSDADDILVKKGIVQDDRTIDFEDVTKLTAERIYDYFGIELPRSELAAPGM